MKSFKHEIMVQLAHHARRAQDMQDAVAQATVLQENATGEHHLRVTLQAPRNSKMTFDKVKFFSDVDDLLPAMEATLQFQMSLVDEYLETLEGQQLDEDQAVFVADLRRAEQEKLYAYIVQTLISNHIVSYREF